MSLILSLIQRILLSYLNLRVKFTLHNDVVLHNDKLFALLLLDCLKLGKQILDRLLVNIRQRKIRIVPQAILLLALASLLFATNPTDKCISSATLLIRRATSSLFLF